MARDGKLDVKMLGGAGAGPGKAIVHDGVRAKWGAGFGGWAPEVIYTGYARVASDVIPPGLRVPSSCTLTEVYLRAKIAPTGASLVWLVKVNGTTAATLTLTTGSASTSSTGLSVALAAGDIVTFDITGIGSTIAGAHLAAQLIAA